MLASPLNLLQRHITKFMDRFEVSSAHIPIEYYRSIEIHVINDINVQAKDEKIRELELELEEHRCMLEHALSYSMMDVS